MVAQKREDTFLEKYGDKHYFKTEDFRNKSKETCLEKYGTEFANQSVEVKEKIRDSLIEHYGTIEDAYKEFTNKSKQTRSDIISRFSNLTLFKSQRRRDQWHY